MAKSTAGKSQLLEQAIWSMHGLGFQIYESMDQFQRAHVVPPRYVIRNYPSPSIYGTPGRKEAFIVASPPSPGFILDPDDRARVLVEAKWQQTQGSVDEKMPFVWQSFLESDVPNWIVVMGGANWNTTRGRAVVAWMQARQAPEDRTWHVVVGAKGFAQLTAKTWRPA